MKSITIYGRSTCAPCNQIKQFLNHKGFTYTVKDVDVGDNAQEAYSYSGASIVPVTVITGEDDSKQVISGYNLRMLVPALV